MTIAVQPIDTSPAQDSNPLNPYPAYQESRLPWVPEVPGHWGLLPNRAMLSRRKVLVGARHTQYRLLSLTKEGVIVRDVASGKGKFSSDMGTSQEVRRGDLIFCFFDVPETPRTVGLSHHDGMITSAYTVLQCQDPALASFLELFYRAMDDRKLLSPLYSGLRNTIPPSRFLGTKTPVPLPDEQSKIVAFLNHMDRLTRIYIRAKQKLISLLNEQKQAIVQRAVTRGLNPKTKMKVSGTAAIGDIPDHWDCLALWTIARPRVEKGHADIDLLSVYLDRGVIPYSEGGGLVHKPSLDLSGYQLVHPGDLVLNNQQAWRGSLGVSPLTGIVSPAYIVFRLADRFDRTFANYLFRSRPLVDQFMLASRGVGSIQRQIHAQSLRVVRVPIPPVLEQQTIAAHLRDATGDLDKAIDAAHRHIELLREYRTCLISDVVTGKVDVRNVPVESIDAETAAVEEACEVEPEEEAVNANA